MRKKVLSLCMATIMSVSLFSGCTQNKAKTDDGKIHISIGGNPSERTEANAAQYDLFQENVKKFTAENPNVEVVPDGWSFDLKNYLTKAAAGDLPTTYFTSPTEIKTIVKNDYAADMTEIFKKFGFDKELDPKYEKLYKLNGKYYGIVKEGSLYTMGIAYNVKLFKEAGLTDESGLPIFPKTWEELAETAKIIHDKTGKAGFMFPSTSNHGGWQFMDILWAYGADMMEEKDGKWTATFASDAGVKALEYIKDLKWKYGVLQDETLADTGVGLRMLSTNECAMTMVSGTGVLDQAVEKYGLDVTNVAMSSLPAGPKGAFSQVGASIYLFSGTDKENEAALKWLEFTGTTPQISDTRKEQWEKNYQIKKDKKQVVGVPSLTAWKSEERANVEKELMDKYRTVDAKNFANYVNAEGVTFKFEPERCVQQMYACLDNAIQTVFTDKNADCKAILEKAQDDFQKNYLDKEN